MAVTKKDLELYISNFNKKPGTYTDDELYNIGVMHKQVQPRSDRSWSWLAGIVGIQKSGETYRNWVNDRQKGDGTLKKDKTKLSSRTIDDLDTTSAIDELTKQKQELFIQQTKTRDERAAYYRTLRDEARIESLKDCISEAASKLTGLPAIKFVGKTSKDTSAEAVLLLSDLHIGAYCNNFYNKYDIDIAKARLTHLIKTVELQCKRNNVKKLTILNLGDMIQGNIHINARINQCENVIDQTIHAAELLAEAINSLQAAAPTVVYRSVVDNHSRITPNKEEHIEKENLNRIIDWWIKTRLANTKILFIDEEDKLDIGLDVFTLENGKKMAYCHGHEDKINTSFQNIVGATKDYIDYIVMGHMHNTKLKSFNGAKVIINGSIMGTDDYALKNRLFGPAEQTLLIFEDDILHEVIVNLQEVE